MKRRVLENTGKLFLDLAKLSFGSFILGTILKGETDISWLFFFGFLISVVFVAVGLHFIAESEE